MFQECDRQIPEPFGRPIDPLQGELQIRESSVVRNREPQNEPRLGFTGPEAETPEIIRISLEPRNGFFRLVAGDQP